MGTPVDLEKAIKLFESAGKQGNAEALYNLGSIYMRKHGDRNPDFNEALHHFYLAAQYSHTRSIHNLAKVMKFFTYLSRVILKHINGVTDEHAWNRNQKKLFSRNGLFQTCCRARTLDR